MTSKLLMWSGKINGVEYGLYPPEKLRPPMKDIKVWSDGEFYPEYLLTQASLAETIAWHEEIVRRGIILEGCYWMYVSSPSPEDLEGIKPGHVPVYHFGIKTVFSGRSGFNWSREGGVLYRISQS